MEDRAYKNRGFSLIKKQYLCLAVLMSLVLLVAGTGVSENSWSWSTLGDNEQRTGFISESITAGGCNSELFWRYKSPDPHNYSPVCTEQYVVFGTNNKSIICLERFSGALHWEHKLNGCSSYQTFYKDYLFFGDSTGIFSCLDPEKNEVIWNYDIGSAIVCCPIVNDDGVFFGSLNHTFYKLDHEGNLIWSFNASKKIFSSPVVYENSIIFASEDQYVYSLNSKSGVLNWKMKCGKPSWDSDHKSNPVIFDGRVFIGVRIYGSTDAKKYAIISLDASNGEKLWETKFPNMTYSFSVDDKNRLYSGSQDGNFYCLNTQSGEIKWNFKTSCRIVDSPVTDGLFVLVPS